MISNIVKCHPGSRRDGIRDGHAGGEELQGREDHRDLRGHQRGPETRHRRKRPQGVRILIQFERIIYLMHNRLAPITLS